MSRAENRIDCADDDKTKKLTSMVKIRPQLDNPLPRARVCALLSGAAKLFDGYLDEAENHHVIICKAMELFCRRVSDWPMRERIFCTPLWGKNGFHDCACRQRR